MSHIRFSARRVLSRRRVGSRRAIAGAATVLGVLLCGTVGSAQELTIEGPPPNPGWLFTHMIGASALWDDNVSLSNESEERAADYLTTANPRVSLGFHGRHLTFDLDYRGSYRFYRTLSALNGFDQRTVAHVSRRISRDLAWFARNSFTVSPTTDDIDVAGINFRRVGARLDDFAGGINITPSRRTTISSAYTFQWVDFSEEERLAPLFRGGVSHGNTTTITRKVSRRLSIGGEYNLRHAIVAGGTHQVDIQHSTANFELDITRSLELSAGVGYSWFASNRSNKGRSAPAFRVNLTREGQRIAWTLLYRRSFMPSFGFGGTFQNQELRANLLMPLGRRFDWTSTVTIREDEPLTPDEIHLRSVWVRNAVSILATRWMRLEGFYLRMFQDSRRAGGEIGRTVAGFQVVSTALRIR